ncbi:MAG TPA: aminotransferase class V-fold PLP-dependent enzyme [Candidatus Ozemobacteraceae bacterium]|nr:aminotransferase class V-fold PLP-dependent enzyme [Candidatus Ozemobacteraceae bacterium]
MFSEAERQTLFPITRTWSYLNHAAIGPLPTPVIEAAQTYLARCSQQGEHHWEHTGQLLEHLRSRLAASLRCLADEVTFTRNVSEGISFLASGLDWSPGDNVILPAIEFPANVYPWLNQARNGVETRYLPVQNGVFTVSELERLVDQRTRVVSVSAVQFFGGYRAPLAEIGAFCRSRGIIFCVDAIQWLGAGCLNVVTDHIDFLACGGHKWLMAGEGIGFVYCRSDLAERLHPGEVGWQGVKQWLDFSDLRLDFQPGARRFTTGTVSAVGLHMLDAAWSFLETIGWSAITAQVIALARRTAALAQERGWQPVIPPDHVASGIVSIRIPSDNLLPLITTLREQGIQISAREGALRVSPQFYNTDDDLDRLFQALDRLVPVSR